MADVTTLDNLINNLAQEAKSFDENISVLFSITQNLTGENIAFPIPMPVPDGLTPTQGKIQLLDKYISDVAIRNVQLVEITKRLFETL